VREIVVPIAERCVSLPTWGGLLPRDVYWRDHADRMSLMRVTIRVL
jgi:hypothetical protein